MKGAIIFEDVAEDEREQFANHIEVVEDIGSDNSILGPNELHDQDHADKERIADDADEEWDYSVNDLIRRMWNWVYVD